MLPSIERIKGAHMSENTNFKTLVGVIIEAEMAGRPRHELLLELGETPAYILQHCEGFAALDMVLKAKNLGKMVFDHGMKKGMIERLPEILAKPKALYKSASTHVKDASVIMTFETHNGFPIIIAVHPGKLIGRRQVNEVASMYFKEGPNPEVKWKSAGLLLWEA